METEYRDEPERDGDLETLEEPTLVATSQNLAELVALQARLVEAGIPCRTQVPNLILPLSSDGPWGTGQGLLVSRAREAEARGIIEAARQSAIDAGLVQVFTEGESGGAIQEIGQVGETDEDGLLRVELRFLREAEPEERQARLGELLGQWMAGGLPVLEVARRLALAGLSFEQARDFYEGCRVREHELGDQGGSAKVLGAGLLVAFGVGLAFLEWAVWGPLLGRVAAFGRISILGPALAFGGALWLALQARPSWPPFPAHRSCGPQARE